MSKAFEVFPKQLFLALLIAAFLFAKVAAAQQNTQCDGVGCEQQQPKPRVVFPFELLFKPVPRVVVKPAPKPAAKPQTVPKQKPSTIKKPAPIRKKPAPQIAVVPKPAGQKPKIPKPSWAGLQERPVTVLLPRDLEDIEGSYIVDLNVPALANAGFDLALISATDLARLLGLESNQIRNIQRRFLSSATLNATPGQAQAMVQNPFVAAVGADTQIKAAGGQTTRQNLPLSWGLDRLDGPSLPLDNSFDRVFGDYETRIYVFDSGIAANLAEFENRVTFGATFVPDRAKTEGGCNAHGTEMASLLAGLSTGSAPKANIVDVVVLPCANEQTGAASSLIEAVEWLLIREADFGDGKPAVANMSLAGKWSRSINNAVSILTENGIAVVVAAGNNADDACRYSPASAKDAVTVAATGPDDETPGFSNFGQCVDIHAPGRLLTTLSVDQVKDDNQFIYVATSGTSGATALVSGLLARSLKTKGPKAASQWLLESGVPAPFWRKQSNAKAAMFLAQASPKWRSSCRISALQSGIKLRARPGPQGKTIKTLEANSVVVVETVANGWARIKDTNHSKGWVSLQSASRPTLLDLQDDGPCKALN